MAKTLAEKFFIKADYSVAVINAPDDYLNDLMHDIPENVRVAETLDGEFDIIQFFATQQDHITDQIDALKASMKDDSYIWFCYPKGGKKAKIPTDLSRDTLWEVVKDYDLKAVHQISIDDTWSSLRFRST